MSDNMAQVTPPSPMTYIVNGMDGYIFPGTARMEPSQQNIANMIVLFFSRHCSPSPLQLVCPIEMAVRMESNWIDLSIWRYVIIDGVGEFKWHQDGPRLDLQLQVDVTSILELPDRSQYYLPRHILDWALIWLPEIGVPIEESVNDEGILAEIDRQRNIESLVLSFRHHRPLPLPINHLLMVMDGQGQQQQQQPVISLLPLSSSEPVDSLVSSDITGVSSISSQNSDDQTTDEEMSLEVALRRMTRTLNGMEEMLDTLKGIRDTLAEMSSNSKATRMETTEEEIPSFDCDAQSTKSSLTFVDPSNPTESQQRLSLMKRVYDAFRM